MTPLDSLSHKQSFIYHSTAVENLQSILRNGIQPADATHRDTLEEDLTHTAQENGIDLPITRQNCVFCYASTTQTDELTTLKSEIPAEKNSGFYEPEAVVMVDGTQLETPVFVGEFRLISDAIDFQYMDAPDDAIISDSYEDALRRYATSLTPVESFTELDSICNEFLLPEVVIENSVPASAILEWVQ